LGERISGQPSVAPNSLFEAQVIPNPRISVIVLAAGSGSRFGGDKVRAELGGKPVWRWSHDVFKSHPGVSEVIVVGETIPGGATRLESCLAGIAAVSDDAQLILIHDGARPFVSGALIQRVVDGCMIRGAAAATVAVADTLRSRSTGEVVDRQSLLAMQTPQGAKADLLRNALAAAQPDCPDEIAALTAIGAEWDAVEGDPGNYKITYPDDLRRAQQRFSQEVRTGLGYDVHAFSKEPNRQLWLGGIQFEGEQGLEGHSDADALSHAVVDAVLGAAALGDIGVHFPPSDQRWRGEPSTTFLRHAAKLVREAGWEITHIDASVIAERPKVMPRAKEIRAAVSGALAIEEGRMSVKATTNEGLGSIGRGEGIAALAVATLARWRLD
jgi:2-C-methyl-D-erythritol 4-phosphate cytidylyltransferase/2-C-methyl-D-erythritol 2,4-cyclodiphosphate synthase